MRTNVTPLKMREKRKAHVCNTHRRKKKKQNIHQGISQRFSFMWRCIAVVHQEPEEEGL